jgi:hypothetical protein
MCALYSNGPECNVFLYQTGAGGDDAQRL